MKNAALLTLILLSVLLLSCDKKDCPLCTTPPEMFVLELVDETSGENLFTIDSFDSETLKVIDLLDSSAVEFQFIDENELNLIQIHTIGWQTEVVNYSIEVDGTQLCILHVDADRADGECCDYTEFHEVDFNGVEFSRDNTTGIYRLFIEL